MLDLLIVLAFVAYSITVGFVARRRASRGLGEYFLAGRGLKGWQSGTSMAATQFAADTPLLVAGLVATGGVFLVWRLWVYGLAFLLMAFLFAALWRRSGVLTDAELTEKRYSGHGVLALRSFKALYYGTILNCFLLAMVLVAAIGIAEAFLPWHQWLPGDVYGLMHWLVETTGVEITSGHPPFEPGIATANNLFSILSIVAFTTLFSLTGWLRGVVTTDLMQFTLALIGTMIFAWIIVSEAGGVASMTDELVDQYGEDRASEMLSFAPGWEAMLLPFLTIMSLQWFFQFASDGTGYLAQRTMACANDRQAQVAGVTFAWLQILLRSLPWMLIAVGLLVVYPFSAEDAAGDDFAAARELAFVHGINDLMPPGARGILLAGMLAALASTLDTHLNWGASYWSNDLYKRLLCEQVLNRQPDGRELVLVARLSYFALLIIAAGVMVNLDSIQQAWQLSLLFGAGVGSVLVLRWIWERINLWSELAAMAASLIVAPLVLITLPKLEEAGWFGSEPAMAREAIGLLAMAVCSTAAAVGVTWFTPRTDHATLDSFYRTVQPAGLWPETADRCGDDRSRPRLALRAAIGRTALTAASLFMCLYGFGRLLLPHPDTPIFWPIAAALLGVALVPVWVRQMSRADGAVTRPS